MNKQTRRSIRKDASQYGESFGSPESLGNDKAIPFKTRVKNKVVEKAVDRIKKVDAKHDKRMSEDRIRAEAISDIKQGVRETGKAAVEEVGRRVKGSAPAEVLDAFLGKNGTYLKEHGDPNDEKYLDPSDTYTPTNFSEKVRRGGAALLAVASLSAMDAAGVPVQEPAIQAVSHITEPIGDGIKFVARQIDNNFENNNMPPGGEPAVWQGGELISPDAISNDPMVSYGHELQNSNEG